jgi:hypothetical protein
MCLYINDRYPHKYEALRDIKVYKFLSLERRSYFSPFQKVLWKKGMRRTVDRLGAYYDYAVEYGLHSYYTLRGGIPLPRFYAPDIRKVEMIVPKGALFYIGTDGDIVSTQLAWYPNRVVSAKPLTLKELP